MKTKTISIVNLSLITGLFICLGMMGYFLIMKVANLAHISELRFLNVLILAAGAIGAIKYYNGKTEKHIKYLNGLCLGFSSVLIGSILFAAFIFAYFKVLDPGLLNNIRVDAPVMGTDITPLTAAISVIAEGFVAGLVISFILMQYFKDDTFKAPFKQVST
jgi:hypothetical protein